MTKLYILKDSRGRVVYEGDNQRDCASLRNTEISNAYTEYRFEVMGNDFLNVKVIDWANDDLCKPREFRQGSSTKWTQIVGTKPLNGLLKLLQSEAQTPPNSQQ